MLKDNSQIISWGKFLIGWPLSIISIAFITKLIIDKSSGLNLNFSEINIFYLLTGVFFFLIYYIFRSFLWRQTLKEKGYKINFRDNTYSFTFSELKRYAPGNIWSFLSRAHQFSRLGVDRNTLGISTLADVQQVIIGCGLITLIAIPWFLDSSNEFKLKLVSLFPLLIAAIAIFFIVTGFIYQRKFKHNTSQSIVLHSSILSTDFILPGFSANSKIKLILISAVTYFIFGVGNFFVLLSVYNIGFNEFLNLSSFFTFYSFS